MCKKYPLKCFFSTVKNAQDLKKQKRSTFLQICFTIIPENIEINKGDKKDKAVSVASGGGRLLMGNYRYS